jgi:glycosyltransferase involved in cell wall biosynthesis
MGPHISTVTPTLNRDRLVGRVVGSSLGKHFEAFELIVADDEFTEGSAAAVEHLAGPPIRLTRSAESRGHCAARNTGVASAIGTSIPFVDSYDELIEGALSLIATKTQAGTGDTARLGFRFRLSNEKLSAEPWRPGTRIYIRAIPSLVEHRCTRRT